MSARFITASHPQHGKLWAAIDPESRVPEPRVCERKFSAFMRPFRTDDAAIQALLAAGGGLEPAPVEVARRKINSHG